MRRHVVLHAQHQVVAVITHGVDIFAGQGGAVAVAKKLLTEWTTAIGLLDYSIANYEGMCLGPKLADGGQVIVFVADSQNQYGGILKDWIRTLVVY